MPQIGNQRPPHLSKNWKPSGGKCSICNSEDVDAINRHIVFRTLSMRTGIPARYGVGQEALFRHNRRHLTADMKKKIIADVYEEQKLAALQQTDDTIAEIKFDSRAAFSNLTNRVDKVLKAVEKKLDEDDGKDFDVGAFVKLAGELRKANEVTAKLVGDLTNHTRVTVLASDPAWLQVRDRLWRWITSEAPDVRARFITAMRYVDRFENVPAIAPPST